MESKLNKSQIDSIRSEYSFGKVSQVELAKRYGVTQPHISRVLKQKRWRDESFVPAETRKCGDAYLIRDIYNYYKSVMKHTAAPVDFSAYVILTTEFNKKLSEKIISRNEIFRMPYDLGFLFIGKRIPTGDVRPIDWVETKKNGFVVKNDNVHTGGYIYSIRWDKKKRYIRNKQFFRFYAASSLKNSLCKAIRNGYDTVFDVTMKDSRESFGR